MTAQAEQQLAVREQIFNFLHLSNDIYRNQDDAEFADQGGQIIYVFDATVFHLFYDTVRWRHAVSSFYASRWTPGPARHQWDRIEAQSALIASEYMLSESLPGARNRDILLTPWHRHELARNLTAIVRKTMERPPRPDAIARELEQKVELLNQMRSVGLDRDERPPPRDPMLDADLKELRQHVHDPGMLARYELTRRAAAILVRCQHTEQLDQIHRLVSRPLLTRIKSVSDQFEVPVEDTHAVLLDAQQWYMRIAREVEGTGESGRPTERRPPGIWNDARSIALCRWIARKALRRDQRIVFVTSDNRVFDAYRRWWVDEGDVFGAGEDPFLMRRSFQYTPIFNLIDAQSDVSASDDLSPRVRQLFERIREAVEIALLPFNLSSMKFGRNSDPGGSRIRGREFLSLHTRDYRSGKGDLVIDFFMQRLGASWYDKQKATLDDITELWRVIERIGIGLFHEQIIKRLEDDRVLFGPSTGNLAMQDPREIIAFFSNSLEALTQRTRAAWLPSVQEFFASEAGLEGKESMRAPRTVWYELPGNRSLKDAIRDWQHGSTGKSAPLLDDSQSAPEAPFVLAAAFAMAIQDWWKAEEFAEYALSACSPEIAGRQTIWELRFLAALTKRFRFGSHGRHLEASISSERIPAARASRSRALEVHAQARALIDQCIDHYAERSTPAIDAECQLFRATSERAALTLFLIASELLTNPLVVSGDRALSLAGPLAEAAQDLERCLQMDQRISAASVEDKLDPVRRQFRHNIAAAETLRFVSAPSSGFTVLPAFKRVADAALEVTTDREEALNRVERIVFLILSRKASDQHWAILEHALTEGAKSPLALDRALCRAIHTRKDALFQILLKR